MKDIKVFLQKHREGLLYLICGGGTVAVSMLTYVLFVWLGLEVNVSNILSWVCAVSFAFIVNKWIVFLSKDTTSKILIKECSSFFAARIFTGVIAIVGFPILIQLGLSQSVLGIDGFLAKIIVTVMEIILNYFASKYYIFKK